MKVKFKMLNKLSDKFLIYCFVKAVDLGLDQNFIVLLKEEINKRSSERIDVNTYRYFS
jgi:hypothetical protein